MGNSYHSSFKYKEKGSKGRLQPEKKCLNVHFHYLASLIIIDHKNLRYLHAIVIIVSQV